MFQLLYEPTSLASPRVVRPWVSQVGLACLQSRFAELMLGLIQIRALVANELSDWVDELLDSIATPNRNSNFKAQHTTIPPVMDRSYIVCSILQLWFKHEKTSFSTNNIPPNNWSRGKGKVQFTFSIQNIAAMATIFSQFKSEYLNNWGYYCKFAKDLEPLLQDSPLTILLLVVSILQLQR